MAASFQPVWGPDLADADNSRAPHLHLDCNAASSILKAGGLVIYPTETFWALGCAVRSPRAVAAIFRIKNRARNKPLPLIAADTPQAGAHVDLDAAPEGLLQKFWPGPLSLLLPVKKYLAPGLINSQHKAALRVSSCACATGLARLADCPLVATSANLSGAVAAAARCELTPQLLAACMRTGLPWGIMAAGEEMPAYSQPSTLAEPFYKGGSWELRILRSGAVKNDLLTRSGWRLS